MVRRLSIADIFVSILLVGAVGIGLWPAGAGYRFILCLCRYDIHDSIRVCNAYRRPKALKGSEGLNHLPKIEEIRGIR